MTRRGDRRRQFQCLLASPPHHHASGQTDELLYFLWFLYIFQNVVLGHVVPIKTLPIPTLQRIRELSLVVQLNAALFFLPEPGNENFKYFITPSVDWTQNCCVYRQSLPFIKSYNGSHLNNLLIIRKENNIKKPSQ